MTGDTASGLVVAAAVALACLMTVHVRVRRKQAARRRLARVMNASCMPRGWSDLLRARLSSLAESGRTGLRHGWPAVAAALGGVVLVGGVAGCVLGLAAAYGTRLWRRKRSPPAADARSEETAVRQLPLACDLMAACLAAGAGPAQAAAAVGRSLGGPVGERLARAASELRLGSEPADAWGRLGALTGADGLARCLERATTTGAPAVEAVTRVAVDCRAEQERAATARARRAGVLATAPLGLCFLPAFLTVGVAPVLIGLASGLLRGG